MTVFSSTDAALEGFRLTRERPRVLFAWAGFTLAASLVGAVITLLLPKEARAALESLAGDQSPDPKVLLDSLFAVAPILVVGLVVQRMMDAAVYRVLLRPEEKGLAYLRLGADELRLTALRLIYLVLAVLLIAVVQFAIAILTLVASPLGQGAMVFVASVAELFSWGVIFVVAIRMSLASVLTFEHRRFAILDSWKLTEGQFWRLFSAYLLALCCTVVMGVLAFVIFSMLAGAALVATGGSLEDLRGIMQPEEVTLATYLNPFVLAYTLLGSLFTAVYSAVIAAPGAFAYRELTAKPPPLDPEQPAFA